MSYQAFKAKLASGETIYFVNTFEQIVIRSEPNNKYFAKAKGGEEYPVASNTELVTEAILEHKEITKEEFDKW